MGLISWRFLILNATKARLLETLLQEFFVPFNLFLICWDLNALLLYFALGTE